MDSLNIKNQLHGNPQEAPQFSLNIEDSQGQTQAVACPQATRALVALMGYASRLRGSRQSLWWACCFC